MSKNDNVLKVGEFSREPVQYRVTVIEEGNCRAAHKKGETFEFDWKTPEGFCPESFVGMYPILHSLRVMGDMRELGSTHRNVRIYNCPSRVIKFQIEAIYRCNLCGRKLSLDDTGAFGQKLENPEANINVRICPDCYEEHKNKTLVW
ncbi:MAG: TIGR04076 family protein [Candidatus Hermodarchaeota archaeon]